MKAILVKYNPKTNKLRAYASGLKTITASRDYSIDLREQEWRLAYKMLSEMMGILWFKDYGLSDGTLPNGDAVFTIINKQFEEFKKSLTDEA